MDHLSAKWINKRFQLIVIIEKTISLIDELIRLVN